MLAINHQVEDYDPNSITVEAGCTSVDDAGAFTAEPGSEGGYGERSRRQLASFRAQRKGRSHAELTS